MFKIYNWIFLFLLFIFLFSLISAKLAFSSWSLPHSFFSFAFSFWAFFKRLSYLFLTAISLLFLFDFFSFSSFSLCSSANFFTSSWSFSVTSSFWIAPVGGSCCRSSNFRWLFLPFHSLNFKWNSILRSIPHLSTKL